MSDTKAYVAKKTGNTEYAFGIIHVELDENGKPVDFTFVEANEEMARLEGKPVDQLIGHRFFEIFPDDDRNWVELYYEAAYLGKSIGFNEISEQNGRYLHVQACPAGKPGCCACVLTDIRESLMDQIKHQEEHEKAVLREAEQVRIIKNLSRLYTTIVETDLNTGVSKIIGRSENTDAVVGTSDEMKHSDNVAAMMSSFLHPDDKEDMKKFFDAETLQDRMKDTDTVSTEFRSISGKFYLGRFVVQSREESGKVEKVLFVARDITYEKQRELKYMEDLAAAAEVANEANESKTRFLKRMSHDIRTPLNGIIGMLRIMDRTKGDKKKFEECMEKITNSTNYLLNLVNNVLDISKMETGEIELEHKSFDLGEILLSTLPTVSTNASQHSIEFTGGRDDTHIEHRYLIGSPLHINRILMNLASNAIKYNRPGGSIKVYCNELSNDGDSAAYEFVCADTGLGMSEEFQKRAFEPFVREGKQTTTGYGGSGLGLSIVKDIVDRMGGTIELKSKENVGTTIRIVLTLVIDKDYKGAATKVVDEAPDFSGRKALLVEDNDINMEIAHIMLDDMGFDVVCAKNGKEAVDLFSASESGMFECIFMDVMMPVMDGLEATKAIRSLQRPDASTVPIIAMTANAFTDDKKACIDAGMNDHIGKPINNKDVIDVVKKYVK